MRLSKAMGTPGSAPGGLTWDTPDDVVEVPDDLAVELLAIPGAGFQHVPHLEPTDQPTGRYGDDNAVTEAPKRRQRRTADPQLVTE